MANLLQPTWPRRNWAMREMLKRSELGKPTHEERKWMKMLKRMLRLNQRQRELGIPDLQLPNPERLPK